MKESNTHNFRLPANNGITVASSFPQRKIGELSSVAGDYYAFYKKPSRDAFITQAEMYLEDAGLEIIDFDDSDASETSRYYTLADAETHRNGTSKYVIFLRISDHVPKLRDEQYQRIKRRWRATAASLGVKYKVRKITVNGATFYDYDSACDEILRLATDWQKLLHS